MYLNTLETSNSTVAAKLSKNMGEHLLLVYFASYRFRKNEEMISSITGEYFQSCLLEWKQ